MRRLYLKLSLYLRGYCTKHYSRRDRCSSCLVDAVSEVVSRREARRQRNSRQIAELMDLDARR